MTPTSSLAADTLHQIAARSSGERRQRAAAGALSLGLVEQALNTGAVHPFSLARARREVGDLPPSAERSILARILAALDSPTGADAALSSALVRYATELERGHRLPEADATLALARTLAPADPEAALHAGRVARKLRDFARALESYRAARSLDGEGGTIARFAEIGEAVVSADPERALGRVIRRAIAAREAEAAAVGLEERARLRRARGERHAAARDLCCAALRYPEAVDWARCAHALADLGMAAGDPLAAREALRVALECGDAPQREHARSRLHALSRDLRDQVGARRWRSDKRPALVSLAAYRAAPADRSAAPRLARWRERLTARGAAPS